MTKQNRKMGWKRLFFILLTVNIAVIILLLALIFWPVPEKDFPDESETTEKKSSEFVIRTTKENLNELVNAYLSEWLKNTNHQYRISLEDDVHLIGELPVFSSTVPLSVHMEPLIQDNGDAILKLRSISIGELKLPSKKIMEYMKKYLPMPEWVTIDPKNKQVYVAINDMEIRSNFKVNIERFDLEANDLAFKIKVPYQTLGIGST